MHKEEANLNPDQFYSMMKDAMEQVGLTPIERSRFDEILEFNDFCSDLVDKCKRGDLPDKYEFPFVHLTGMMFNRLTPEGRRSLLRDLKRDLDEWS